jgi:type 1 secretion C-terminal target domain (VC_A0849 subclass)
VNESTYGSHDTINGFNAQQDKIDFSAISGLNSNAQHVTINFLTSTPNKIAGHTIDVVTSGGNTIVYTNATGSSENINGNHEDMQINLTGMVAMNSSDFILHH